MSNQNSNRELNYNRPLHVASRGRVVVPKRHHSANLRTVFGATNVSPAVKPDIQPAQKPVVRVAAPSPVVHLDTLLAMESTKETPTVKLPQKETLRDFTAQVLVSAAETASIVNTETPNSTAMIDTAGAAAIPTENVNKWERLAKLNPKITFRVKINRQRVFAAFRYLAVALILTISGYLAWDTWLTNKTVQETFSRPASAMTIDDTNPANVDPTSVSNQERAAYTVPADHPRYIHMPSIGVNARVMSVGVNSKGNIDSPKNANDAAWYDGSAKPGQNGQVFIDGHTSLSSTFKAAFDSLPKLKAGDIVTIERGDGEKINYKVASVETVETGKVDMNKALNVPDGAKQGLTLMTCTGKYDYRTKTADHRVIVYATRE